MKKLFILLFICSHSVFGQKKSDQAEILKGYWEGAFIRENAFQKIDIEFSEKNGEIYALQIMDEWHPTYGEFEVPVEIDSVGHIKLGTGYGDAILSLDPNNLELLGQINEDKSTIKIHLKKSPDRPRADFSIEEISFNSSDVALSGHLHLPFHNPTKTAVILVGGRGCYADQTKYNLYAKFFREYGIATLAYQKRGTGNSTGSCDLATIEDLGRDAASAKAYLEARAEGFEKIGVLGISAGGWVMTKAEEFTNFDFMISVVGPSTSVREQQLQSASYGSDIFGLSTEAKSNLLLYTEMVFDSEESESSFESMNTMLKSAEDQGWIDLLEDTDKAGSVEEIKNLWVRRHGFDPKTTLENFDRPFLAIYGEKDWIVPPKENIDLLEEYFKDRPDLLTTVKAFGADHGMEMESEMVQLQGGQSYWHFYRASPEVRIEIVDFLRRYSFVE